MGVPAWPTVVLFDEFDVASDLNSLNVTDDIGVEDTSTFGTQPKQYTVVQTDGTIQLGGFWNGATDAIDEVMQAVIGSNGGQTITTGFEGLGVGDRVEMLLAKTSQYQRTNAVGGVAAISISAQPDGGIDSGVGLHEVSAETSSSNSASVDNGASSDNGGVAHLHLPVVSASGGDTIDVKVQHSANDSSWADLVTFTQLTTAVGFQRVVVAAGTTVNRYIRSLWTIGGGTPSYTFGVAFARR